MGFYSYIEEIYCLKHKRNVGVEYKRFDDGTSEAVCLSQNSCCGDNECSQIKGYGSKCLTNDYLSDII